MILSMNWLNDYVDVKDIDIKDFCDTITVTGSKVEGWEKMDKEISNVKVGLIKSVEKHPNADKLVVCKVDVGMDRDLQIVTAAKNVYEGALVPVAISPEGSGLVAKVHGGEIKTGKLRGELSEGMFCSIAELGLDLHDMPLAIEEGILILNESKVECKPGDNVVEVLKINDTSVEFEITPNRPDCLSVIGLARETSASFDRPIHLHKPVVEEAGGDIKDYVDVTISDPKCSRYCARVIRNVKIAPSPIWMRMRLKASGVRPINNIVDITNYVMLEYGQPMHAFDYSCISGKKIDVRTAIEGEKFITLDNEERTLSSDTLVIADAERAIGIAGVMGGANSEILESTDTVVFESANFDGTSVRITGKRLNMRTESSGRFEKGLDSEMCLEAVERACELVTLLGAGEVVTGSIDIYPNKKQVYKVPFEPKRINEFLGIYVSPNEMKAMLEKLFFSFDGDDLVVPSFRDDVRCMNDIAEEVVRMYGYNKVEASRIVAQLVPGGLTPLQQYRRKICTLLCGIGYDETCTYSFMSAKLYTKAGWKEGDESTKSVEISNPFGEDTKTMRTSSIPTMLEVLETNATRSVPSVRLFELAKVFIPRENVVTNIHGLEGTLPEERQKIVLGTYGSGNDFYTLKGTVESLIDSAGIKNVRFVANKEFSVMHPGRCADVYINDVKLGTFGELNPTAAKNYTFSSRVYLAELDLQTLFENIQKSEKYSQLPKYPAITRDFSFVCSEETAAGDLAETIKNCDKTLIEKIELFDVFRGGQIAPGMKSLSFSVTLRAKDHTLTVEEADRISRKIISAASFKHGAEIRS